MTTASGAAESSVSLPQFTGEESIAAGYETVVADPAQSGDDQTVAPEAVAAE
jgi:hypothetical protein